MDRKALKNPINQGKNFDYQIIKIHAPKGMLVHFLGKFCNE